MFMNIKPDSCNLDFSLIVCSNVMVNLMLLVELI